MSIASPRRTSAIRVTEYELPGRNGEVKSRLDGAKWICIVSALSLAFQQALPTIPAAIFALSWMCFAVLYPQRAIRAITWSIVPWLVVLAGAFSVIWSNYPENSLRGALQLGLTTFAAVALAQSLSARVYMLILMCVQYCSLLAGMVLPSIFGSKNAFALSAAITLFCAVWVLIDAKQRFLSRTLATFILFTAPVLLVFANSTGATIATIIAIASALFLRVLGKFSYGWRVLGLVVTVLIVLIATGIIFFSVDDISGFFLSSVGKDSTLTGRTTLWGVARDIIANNWIGGVGLQAFWIQGNPDAEKIWDAFFIPTRMGFHFHNLWFEYGVELGFMGLAAVGFTIAYWAYWTIRWVLKEPTPEACFFFCMLVFLLVRTANEVDLFGQFSFVQVTFIASYFYARTALSKNAQALL